VIFRASLLLIPIVRPPFLMLVGPGMLICYTRSGHVAHAYGHVPATTRVGHVEHGSSNAQHGRNSVLAPCHGANRNEGVRLYRPSGSLIRPPFFLPSFMFRPFALRVCVTPLSMPMRDR
jgi:hypothetical protein